MDKNYYAEKIADIKNLIAQEQYQEAKNVIEEELKMPYIPEKYEQTFIDLANEVKFNTLDDKQPIMTISRDVALDYLTSEDQSKELLALEVLSEHNLNGVKELLKRRIESWGTDKNMFKAYLFELMVDQEIDVDVNLNGQQINPRKNGSIMDNPTVLKIMNELDLSFDKNPSLLNSAKQEFERYLLLTYPNVPADDNFANNFVKVIHSLLDNNIELSNEQLNIMKILNDK